MSSYVKYIKKNFYASISAFFEEFVYDIHTKIDLLHYYVTKETFKRKMSERDNMHRHSLLYTALGVVLNTLTE